MRVRARPFLQGVSEGHKVQRTHMRTLKLAQSFRHELVNV
jgi:hypothetical protein